MKKSLLIVVLGIGAGYILGARAGRERYDALVARLTGIWEDPRLNNARRDAARYAREQAPVIRARAEATARDVAERTANLARDVSGKTVSAARDAADRTVAAATEAASRVGEARDRALDDLGDLGDEHDES